MYGDVRVWTQTSSTKQAFLYFHLPSSAWKDFWYVCIRICDNFRRHVIHRKRCRSLTKWRRLPCGFGKFISSNWNSTLRSTTDWMMPFSSIISCVAIIICSQPTKMHYASMMMRLHVLCSWKYALWNSILKFSCFLEDFSQKRENVTTGDRRTYNVLLFQIEAISCDKWTCLLIARVHMIFPNRIRYCSVA